MNKNIPLIPARYYLRLLDLLNQRNIPLSEIMQNSGLDANMFIQIEDAKLSIQQIEQFIEFCLKYPQNSDLAFELGSLLKLSSHSLVGYGVLTSQTAEQAIQLVAQYFKLIIPNFQLVVKKEQHILWLIFEPTMQMTHLTLNFHLEAITIAFYHNLIEILGAHLPHYHIYTSLHEPRHLEKYQKLHKAQFHFSTLNTPSIQFALPKEVLLTNLPMADEFSLKMVEQRCQELLKQLSNSGEIAAWLRMMLREAYQLPSLSDCAKILNISTKTLQRYLKKQNADFQHIRMQVLMERAKYMLEETDKTITDIADELGYATTTNFGRTFKQQTKMTPLAYRHATHQKTISSDGL